MMPFHGRIPSNGEQALLEAPSLAERSNVLISLIEMALLEDRSEGIPYQQTAKKSSKNPHLKRKPLDDRRHHHE
tara:strand:+ start:163 stop:384 length:222 start_codon:yes stop_codon:yes gene_type:complete